MRSFRFISRAAAVLIAAILLLPTASSAQGKNYPETLLKGKKYVKVTDVKQFDKASGAVKEYLRTLSNGVKVPIRVESAYTFKGNDSLYVNFGRNVADYPIRPEGLKKIYELVKNNLPSNLKGKKLAIFAAGSKLEHLMTPFYNSNGKFAKTQRDGIIRVSSTEKRLKEQEGISLCRTATDGITSLRLTAGSSRGQGCSESLKTLTP